ncbi:hypothetical protein, partial [Cupriavidus sp. 8B]
DQGGQGELAMTGESGGTFRMAGMVLKDLGMQVLGKRSEHIGQEHESQAKIEKQSSIGRRPACQYLAFINCGFFGAA